MKNAIYFLLAAALTLSTASLAQQSNPAGMLRDKKQAETLSSLKNLGDGKFYSMNYKADYRLQEFINADIESQEKLRMMIAGTLMDIPSVPAPVPAMKPACTAFKAVTPDGDVIYARNFDYTFTDSGTIMLRTAPKRGYKSISMVSSSFVGISGGMLCDGGTDLSMLVGAPYMQMDGMNEKGLAVSVLHLRHKGAQQSDAGKHTVMTSVMMRMLLDRAATVDEAVSLLGDYNFFADGVQKGKEEWSNYHFFIADARGRSAVLEYIMEGGPDSDSRWVLNVIDDTAVTNYYLSEGWEKACGQDSRYGKAKACLGESAGVMTEEEAMQLLQTVSQPHRKKGDSHTQWSVVYNLSKKTATVCIGMDYGRSWRFAVRNPRRYF